VLKKKPAVATTTPTPNRVEKVVIKQEEKKELLNVTYPKKTAGEIDNAKIDPNMIVETKVKHVKDMIIAGNFKLGKDNSPLWKNFDDSKLERPAMDGVHGHDWSAPIGNKFQTGFKIASPVKEEKKENNRIISDDLPATTYSTTVGDLPDRKNVLQVQLPTSTTKTTEHTIDPRTQLPPNLTPQHHGLEPTKFLQAKEKSLPEVHEALKVNQQLENKAGKMIKSMVSDLNPDKMAIKIVTTNKQEQPALKLTSTQK